MEQHRTGDVRGTLWHSTQKIKLLKNDGSAIEFQLRLNGLEEITRWVLSWGSKARVLGPPELRKRVREELQKMSATDLAFS